MCYRQQVIPLISLNRPDQSAFRILEIYFNSKTQGSVRKTFRQIVIRTLYRALVERHGHEAELKMKSAMLGFKEGQMAKTEHTGG